MNSFAAALAAGYNRLTARADLLDRINVFPVADSDTGANLRISLAPLREAKAPTTALIDQLQQSACGNSGNIAVCFFAELLHADGLDTLARQAARGNDQAWRAVADPQPASMLGVFSRLATVLAETPLTAASCPEIVDHLRQTVRLTASELSVLRQAGVVDAGALGMYLFFDAFLRSASDCPADQQPLAELFAGQLAVTPAYQILESDQHCVEVRLQARDGQKISPDALASLADSVVLRPDKDNLKIHLHTSQPAMVRQQLDRLADIVSWQDEVMHQQHIRQQLLPADRPGCLHVMTDAAGSLSRALCQRHGITLLDSYILSDGRACPESLCDPAAIYARLRAGGKITTAQASLGERQQLYASVIEEHGPTLYLAVGSAYTGNVAAARAWQQHRQGHALTVVDSGAASGRLAVAVLAAVRLARLLPEAEQLLAHIPGLLQASREYVFLDCLRYLAAGGRISWGKSFVADLLHVKPVISPQPQGAQKIATLRDRAGQLRFATEKLCLELAENPGLVLLQYSDNQQWVQDEALPVLQKLAPQAEYIIGPLSLTSGVHMGPGTWSLAFLPGAPPCP